MKRSKRHVNIPTRAWPWPPRAYLLRGLCIFAMAGTVVITTPVPTKSDSESRVRYSKPEIRRAIAFYAKRYKLDPALLRAVIKVESDFQPHVVSRKGAVGLMQLTPDTAATLRIADIHDPVQNIRGGAKQLRHLLTLYEGNVPLALAAYNAGVHRVKGGKIPRIRETKAYVRNVLRYYEMFRAAGSPSQASPASDDSTSGNSRRQLK